MMSTSDICKLVANSPAPRYYVSTEEAMHQYCVYKRTGSLDIRQESSVQMYMEIFNKFDAELERRKSGETRLDIMDRVINSEASSFFLKPSFARVYIYRVMNRRKKRKK